MTKQNKLKKGVRAKALALLLAGLLCMAAIVTTLTSGSLFTPVTAKAADAKPLIGNCRFYNANGDYTGELVMNFSGDLILDSHFYTGTFTLDVSSYFGDYFPSTLNPLVRFSIDTMPPGFTVISQEIFSPLVLSYEGPSVSGLTLAIDIYEVVPKPLPQPPTKEGYTFSGWYTDEACTQKYTATAVTDDLILYAGWTINRYVVRFDTACGISQEDITVNWNTAVTTNTLTRTGYDFLGWYMSNGIKYESQAIKGNTTLTAKWAIKTCEVTFMVEGAAYKTVTVDYGSTFTQAMTIAGMLYYNLLGNNGVYESKSGIITDTVTVIAAEMTQNEKVGAWIGNNMWALWTVIGLVSGLALALSIAITVAHKRG